MLIMIIIYLFFFSSDLSSQLDDSEHPDHKIYRKSVIRFSIVQRVRQLLSEEQRRHQKYPVHKQGSEAMGEKIANPDYVDPHKLFLSSRNCSQINLSVDALGSHNEVESDMGEPELLDLTINEKEVLNELEKRLKSSTSNCSELDTGQQPATDNSSQSSTAQSEVNLNSSQNSDSYYESILEDSLKEEYIRDSSGKLVAKQDSFSNTDSNVLYTLKYRQSETHTCTSNIENSEQKNVFHEKKTIIKRPTKAPPPIPTKPSRLLVNGNSVSSIRAGSSDTMKNSSGSSCNRSISSVSTTIENGNHRSINSSTSWVKTMVGRFE